MRRQLAKRKKKQKKQRKKQVRRTDPYSIVPERASVHKGVNIYSQLLHCKVMNIRAGIVGRSDAVAAALADADHGIAQLKQRMQELEARKQAIMQEGKHEK